MSEVHPYPLAIPGGFVQHHDTMAICLVGLRYLRAILVGQGLEEVHHCGLRIVHKVGGSRGCCKHYTKKCGEVPVGEYICKFGISHKIIVDNGPQLKGE